ncbi:hypothetical protein L6452_42625 [Arctium lappa]|uniref:Uncharacterized protein n=1 Tax=Arctium lappa TaxID=4217 RepID=A0ACB8XKI2_ARCLA|nr:hypothetical protein L6452_42625 [Arctium lappa]
MNLMNEKGSVESAETSRNRLRMKGRNHMLIFEPETNESACGLSEFELEIDGSKVIVWPPWLVAVTSERYRKKEKEGGRSIELVDGGKVLLDLFAHRCI